MRVTPFVLPYHFHSFEATQVYIYLEDLCASDSTKCYQDQYAELTWSVWEQTLADDGTSALAWEAEWAPKVAEKFNLPLDDIKSLWTTADTHDSNHRVRYNWKYGASNGVSGTPSAIVNGVSIKSYPESE